jgi:hypothetical protein
MVTVDSSSSIEQSKDQLLLRLYGYWNERRAHSPFAAPREMDPADYAFAAERVSLIEVHREPLRFRYGFVASQLTAHLGYDMTGMYVDEVPEPSMRQFARACYERAVQEQSPCYEKGIVLIRLAEWWHETLVLPLATDGTTIDALLIYRNTVRPTTVEGHTNAPLRLHIAPLPTPKPREES